MDIDITCPSCHSIDFVQSVPAIHAEGVTSSYGTSTYSGVGATSAGLVPVFGTHTADRVHATALARSFAREPAQQRCGALATAGTLLFLPVLFLVVIGLASLPNADPATTGIATIVGAGLAVLMLAAPSVLCLGAAIVRTRRNQRIVRGRPRALAVWQAGFYCHRCGSAFWPVPPAPGVPARQAFAPPHYRWFVWRAGGYLTT